MTTPLHEFSHFTAIMATTSAQFSVHSVVRGHHVYKKIWTPYLGENLDLHPEVGNKYNRFAVVVIAQLPTGAQMVGRVPIELSERFCKFLRVDCPNIRITNINFWFVQLVEGLLSHIDHPRKSPFVLWA